MNNMLCIHNASEDCCLALEVKNCDRCSFAQTAQQVAVSQAKWERRIKEMSDCQFDKINAMYYSGGLKR